MSDINQIIKYTCAAELRKVAKLAKIYVLKCNNEECDEGITQWYNDQKLDWLIHLECTKCNNQWSICSSCINFQVGLTTQSKIDMHKNTYHNKLTGGNQNNYKKRKHIIEKVEEFMMKRNIKKKTKQKLSKVDKDNIIINKGIISSCKESNLHNRTSSNNSNVIEKHLQIEETDNEYCIQINDNNDDNDNDINGKNKIYFIYSLNI